MVSAASSGMTALLKVNSLSSWMVAMLATHLVSSSTGTWSSQSSFLLHRSCRSSFRLAVTGVASPSGSNTLATIPVRVLLVKHVLRAVPKSPATGSGNFPLFALPNLGGPMSSKIQSSNGRHK